MHESTRLGAWLDGETVRWRVWAPGHRDLEVVLFDANARSERHSIRMRGEGRGFFSTSATNVGPGSLYKIRIDGSGPWPDPFSRSQPHGVHGPSEVLALSHPWSDGAWKGVAMRDAVIYEVHVGVATPEGTFESLIARLKDIRALGATVVELMPIGAFPGSRNWGYDGAYLFAPAHAYGGPRGLCRLVDSAHAEGLGVVLDVVFNHLGPDGNYIGQYSNRFFTDRHRTAWGAAVNLDDEDSAVVREVLLTNVEMWIRDYHLDGVRLDATQALFDNSREHILKAIAERVKASAPRRRVLVIAEDDRNEAKIATSVGAGGYGLDGVWADDFHHQLSRAFAGDREGYFADFTGTARDIVATLLKGWFYEGQLAPHLDRTRGTPAAGLDVTAFIHCIQNHDQVGNRALGDRLGQRIGDEAYKTATALLLLSPYTPLLFMGQEWNATSPFAYFTDHHADLGRLVTEGRRKEFEAFSAFQAAEVPDPQEERTFLASKLKWDERQLPNHAAVLAWYKELLRLRAHHPALVERNRGSFTARALGSDALALERIGGDKKLLLIANIRGELNLEIAPVGHWRVLMWSREVRFGGAREAAEALVNGRVEVSGPAAVVLEAS